MEDYKKIDTNIYCCSDEYYVIKKNDKLYIYDYEHLLVFESKPIKNIIYGHFVNEDTVYFGSTMKRLIYRINIKDKQLDRIRYTSFMYADTQRIFEIENKLYVFYNGHDKKRGYCYALSVLDKQTLKIIDNFILPDNMISWLDAFVINNKIYLTAIDKKSNDTYYHYYLYEKNENYQMIFEILTFNYETTVVSSDDGKYLIIASVDSKRHFGEIIIYDLIKNTIIDKITYEHVAEYRTIYHYFHYDNKDYVIFQANPVYCTWQNDIWHTYLYSIQDKKIIARYPSAFMIRYISNQKMMIVETANKRRKTEFYKVDEQKEDLFEVLDEIHINVKAKSKKIKNDAYFKECPFQKNKPYKEYTEQEAEKLFQSFINDLDERVDCLFKVMSRFIDIPLRYDYKTFETVIKWYFSTFNIKFYIPKKWNKKNKTISMYSLSKDYVFTDLTYITMTYVGVYIGKLIQYHEPKAIWKLDINKNSQYYHQPYIEKTDGKKFYPFIYTETLFDCLLDKKDIDLKEIFQYDNQ